MLCRLSGDGDLLKTLHLHISRELLRVMSLSLVAFTLVMTVFAVIEPLRKQGVAEASQVVVLIGCTLPMMITLTLPVAALFAATIVYGRFSQDNELMACRASGIGTLGLVKPAFILGGIVTVITLLLMNFVTPRLAETAERSVKDNIKGIVFQQLRTQSYVKFENRYILHAERVEPEDKLYGVVVGDTKDPNDIKMCMAPVAFLNFKKSAGDTYAIVRLAHPDFLSTSEHSVFGESGQPFELKLPSPVKENPSWYDWTELLNTQRDPTKDPTIKRQLDSISNRIAHDMLCCELAAEINAGRPYKKLVYLDKRYVITAPRAVVNVKERGQVDLLPAEGDEDKNAPVIKVEEWNGDKLEKTYTSDRGKVVASWSVASNNHIVTIYLEKLKMVKAEDKSVLRRSSYAVGNADMPENVAKRAKSMELATIWKNPGELTQNPEILKSIDNLKERDVPRLLRKIKAEMHIRAGYGVSFFLLVAIGAGLGMIFRGGQLLSAFTLSMAPLLITIILLLMGKQMIGHPQVSELAGVSVIWLGILGLAIATVCVHWRLTRQ